MVWQAVLSAAAQYAAKKTVKKAAGAIASNIHNEQMQHLGLGDLSSYLSSTFHVITVEVTGGPAADLRRCWYLALATMFGRYRRGLKGVGGRTLSAQWDITDKKVSATMAYTFGGTADTLATAAGVKAEANSPDSLAGRTGLSMFQEGPDQVTIGGGWPVFFYTTQQHRQTLPENKRLKWWHFIPTPLGPVGLHVAIGQYLLGTVVAPAVYIAPTAVDTAGSWLITYADFFNQNMATFSSIVFLPTSGHTLVNAIPSVPDVFRDFPYLETGNRYRFQIRTSAPAGQPQFKITITGGGTVPTLPDHGRLITTGEKLDPIVQNCRPPVDGLMKGNLLSMISQALASPGYLIPPPTVNGGAAPIGFRGRFIHQPGAKPLDEQISLSTLVTRRPSNPGDIGIYSGLNEDPTNQPVLPNPTENVR